MPVCPNTKQGRQPVNLVDRRHRWNTSPRVSLFHPSPELVARNDIPRATGIPLRLLTVITVNTVIYGRADIFKYTYSNTSSFRSVISEHICL